MPVSCTQKRGVFLARFLVCLCILFLGIGLCAQQPFLRHYAVEDGLLSSNVRQCLQGKEGYIWMATDAGLNRFDGYEFRSYGIEEGLSNDNILDMSLREDGSILLRTPSQMFVSNQGVIKAVDGYDLNKTLAPSQKAPEELQKLIGDELEVRNYFRGSKGGNWLCTTSDGLYRVWYEADNIRAEHYLENKTVNGLSEDLEGGYWVSTEGSGVYFIPAKVYQTLDVYNGFGTDQLLRLQALPDDWLLAVGNDDQLYEVDLVEGFIQAIDSDELVDQEAFDLGDETWSIENDTISIRKKDSEKVETWAANDLTYNPKLNVAVVGTNLGLYVCSKFGECEHLSTANGFLSNKVRSVFVTGKGNMLLATNRGVTEVYGEKVEGKFRIKNISQSDGLASSDVYDVIKAGNYLCVATNRGLTYFDEKKNKKQVSLPPKVIISSVLIKDKGCNWKTDDLNLKPAQNDIQINYTAISYSSAGDVEYQYLLEGLTDEWIATRNRSVRFSGLAPDDYVFKVRAKGKDGKVSEVSEGIAFTVEPKRSQTWWFRGLIALLSIGFIAALAMWRVRSIHRDNKMKSQMVELEQQALRAQMNPHFIFNSMSSIQQFINTNEKRTANKYLARFAELMRRILYNSRRAYITLKDEVETLQLYLELEALRLDNKLEYEVEVAGNVDPLEIKIPTMFIQPYVENAILHGLPARIQGGDMGKVTVLFRPEKDYLYAEVLDNGIGRERAQAIKENRQIKKESTAMKNIETRMGLLSPNKSVKDLVKVIDLKNEQSEGLGTKIEIKIPYV